MGGVHMIIVIMRVGFATTVLGMGYDNRMHRNMMYLGIFSSYCILVIIYSWIQNYPWKMNQIPRKKEGDKSVCQDIKANVLPYFASDCWCKTFSFGENKVFIF